ncbi:gluconokinase [Aliterella atlantica]|uniref:Gluconokinase n=1 Tax=Aliterella atlantica CENA595 TaxID=1618023 RepID=A0A0D8ZRP6_9CYAN|nr:gluconokinase [Aliterella atlantica]KJH71027.1 gluconate kinase [Aliterella atlantica CENA595]
MIVIVMGVSGSGKTTIGKQLAASLQWEFRDADTFHSPENVEKMRRGIPLSETDRLPWLKSLQTAIAEWLQADKNVVLACSALKQSYRQYLMLDSDRVKLVYLKGSYQLIYKRLQMRQNHYMSAELLNSQFDLLEEPADAISVDISAPTQVILQTIESALKL